MRGDELSDDASRGFLRAGDAVAVGVADSMISTETVSVVVAVTVVGSTAMVANVDALAVGHWVGNDVIDAAVELSCA